MASFAYSTNMSNL